MFVLSQVIDYFTVHDTTVYLALLDASKAFDRANHIKLIKKCWIRVYLSLYLVLSDSDWYGKVYSVVRWKDSSSVR